MNRAVLRFMLFTALAFLGFCHASLAQGDWHRVPLLEGRSGAAMAYDSVRGRVVLFGGIRRTTFGDTWEWDGSSWSQASPAVSPALDPGASMAWDPVRQTMILFERFPGVGPQTWEWDGTSWTQLQPASSPGSRQ